MEEVPRKRGWALPWVIPTGRFVHDYLLEHGEAYVQEIWRALKTARMERGREIGKTLGVCSYSSFRSNYVWVLKKLGLIEEVKRKSVKPGWFRRRYYRIVPGKEDDPAWDAPQRFLDPRRALGKRRYKKRKV